MIGTNKKDAADTVARILEDVEAGALNDARAGADAEAIAALLAERVPGLVTWAGWQAIDAHEKTAGEPHGRPRVKLVRVAELVEARPRGQRAPLVTQRSRLRPAAICRSRARGTTRMILVPVDPVRAGWQGPREREQTSRPLPRSATRPTNG